VDTEFEAGSLILLTCQRSLSGGMFAPELADEQTIDNLIQFSHRLHKAYKLMRKKGSL
jgi:hypothetical protein